jgi:nicotinate-nucleotide adenylyltransferase
MRIAVLGGTFNPVHIGHLYIAQCAVEMLGYDRIAFVPANVPAHKDVAQDVDPGVRIRMVRLAVRDNTRFVCDAMEVARGGISYTIDTVRELEKRCRPEGRVGVLIGDDLLSGFPRWKEAGVLAEVADLLVYHRQSAERLPFDYRHRYLENTIVSVSSTEIRQAAGAGRTIRYLVPERVRRFIERRGLYRV